MNYFVIGTDTGVGKTLVSCALLHGFAMLDKRVVGMKPVAAGCDADGQNDDVLRLRAASNVSVPAGLDNPYAFQAAVAPHLAAQVAGTTISLERIVESYQSLQALAEVVVVEGVGGFRVPLNAEEDSADLAMQLNIPLILVAGMRLGCLNHALLTAEALGSRRLVLAGWVANILDNDMVMLNENIDALRHRIPAPLLGVIPHQVLPDSRKAAACLNLALLTQGCTV